MKAILIDPQKKEVSHIDVDNQQSIADLVGYASIISDEIGDNGDLLFFDEDCFLRGTDGRFQIDSLVPVAGKGVIIGSDPTTKSLQNVQLNIDELKNRFKYI